MKQEKIPPYLTKRVDTILREARSKITIHYNTYKNGAHVSTGCQIIDHNDYSVYFYEPAKFEIIEPKVIKCIDQRSAHQNGIIALKRWENEIKNFLLQPIRKMEISRGIEHRKISVEKGNSTLFVRKELTPSVSRVQKTLRGRRVVIH